MSAVDPIGFERQFVAFLGSMAEEVPASGYRAPRSMLRRANARAAGTIVAAVLALALLALGSVLMVRALRWSGVLPGSHGAVVGTSPAVGPNRSPEGTSGVLVSSGEALGGLTGPGSLGPDQFGPYGPFGLSGRVGGGPDGGGWGSPPGARRGRVEPGGGAIGPRSPGGSRSGSDRGKDGSSGWAGWDPNPPPVWGGEGGLYGPPAGFGGIADPGFGTSPQDVGEVGVYGVTKTHREDHASKHD